MKKSQSPRQKERKTTLKILKFWFEALLGTDLMDDVNHRKEYLRVIEYVKKQKRI